MAGIRDTYAAGLAWLFGQLRAAFDQSTTVATIEARAPTRHGYTDTTPTWATVVDFVPCLVRPLRAEAVQRQNRDVAQVWVEIYFDSDPGVTRNHRIKVGDRIFSPATTLDLDTASALWRVDCTEIKGA